MNARERYATPAAFRAALSDRLRNSADSSMWTIQQLQRQVAYDRLLERLYFVDDGWIVKGATALLARDLGVRGSLDVDVYRADAQEIAEADLRRAAEIDLDDWFVFNVGVATPIGNNGLRFPVVANIGQTTWAEFHVDLSGSDLRITGHPDDVPPIARGIIPSVEQSGYRAYPLADHVADKVAATYERHGVSDNPSTRYRDLIDLVSIATRASIDSNALSNAIRSEFERRSLVLPDTFDVPDRELWERGYAAEVNRSFLEIALTLDEALVIVRSFLDPLLRGVAEGIWNPTKLEWT
jgi:lambda repressor-like predicted transcriptional regulator